MVRLSSTLRQNFGEHIAGAGSRLLLLHYSSDCTPLSSKKKRSSSLPSGTVVPQSHEYLVQHCFLRYTDSTGQVHTCCLLRDPLPLQYGKGVLACFSAARPFILYPKQLGHSGVQVTHYVFDRSLNQPLGKLFKNTRWSGQRVARRLRQQTNPENFWSF